MFYFGQIIEQALLMFPLVLGIYISLSILKIADLTVDGSFMLGAAVFAALSAKGMPLYVSMMGACASGACAGAICALVQQKNRLDPLIAGILMAFILHSLGLLVMERPNIGLLQSATIFNFLNNVIVAPPLFIRVASLAALMILLAIGLSLMLSTRFGLWLKAFGNNQNLVALLGKNPETLRVIGLAVGNSLAAFSGCLTAQASGYADINMGFGQALIGIAMILLGREFLHLLTKTDVVHDALRIACVFLGTVVYFLLTNELIRFGLNPVYLKMAIGIFLIAFLLFAGQREASLRGFLS